MSQELSHAQGEAPVDGSKQENPVYTAFVMSVQGDSSDYGWLVAEKDVGLRKLAAAALLSRSSKFNHKTNCYTLYYRVPEKDEILVAEVTKFTFSTLEDRRASRKAFGIARNCIDYDSSEHHCAVFINGDDPKLAEEMNKFKADIEAKKLKRAREAWKDKEPFPKSEKTKKAKALSLSEQMMQKAIRDPCFDWTAGKSPAEIQLIRDQMARERKQK